MKYMVMECHESYAVLMDEESRFVQAANLRYKVGQTVTDPVLMNAEELNRGRISMHISKFVAAAACLTIAVSAGAFYYSSNYKTHSTVLISSEANVRMELNKKGKVLNISTENADSDEIIKNYDGKGKDMLDAANDIIDIEKDKGIIESGDTVDIYIKAETPSEYNSYKSDLITGIPDVKVKVRELDGNKPHEKTPPEPPKADPAKDNKKPDPPKPADKNTAPKPDDKAEPPKPAEVTPPTPAAPPAANNNNSSSNNTAPQVKQPDAPPAPPISPEAPEPPKPADKNTAPKPDDKAEPPKPDEGAGPPAPAAPEIRIQLEKEVLDTIRLSEINPYIALTPLPEPPAPQAPSHEVSAPEAPTPETDKNTGPAREALPEAEKIITPPLPIPLP